MTPPKSRCAYPMLLALFLMAACAESYPLRVTPLTEEWYPTASQVLGEEGRVLVELHLSTNRRLRQEPIIRQPAGVFRLDDSIPRVTRALRFEPWGDARPDPKHAYLVTIIFCLDPPGNCGRIAAYRDSVPVIVRGRRRSGAAVIIGEFEDFDRLPLELLPVPPPNIEPLPMLRRSLREALHR